MLAKRIAFQSRGFGKILVRMIKKYFGVAAAVLVLPLCSVSAKTLFVSAQSANAVAPFSAWTTAATNLQQAMAEAAAGDVILVTNGVYGPVVVDKAVSVRSLNGPLVTILDSAHQSRCANLTNGSSLAGFSLRNGADVSGGGVLCSSSDVFLTNCLITANQVRLDSGNPATGNGGGVHGGTLYNCVIVSNSAAGFGGGAFGSRLYNCTVTGNRADRQGGGVYRTAATNCIVYFNKAGSGNDNHGDASLGYCCGTPMLSRSAGNITNAPEFLDYAAGDLRLKGISPCIDAGDNANAVTSFDFSGNPRIIRGRVDMGAYEFPGTNELVFYSWVQHHGVPIDGLHDYDDPDGDGMNNWQEWVCFTCPTNSLMNLRLLSAVPTGPNVVLRWRSYYDINYLLERSTNRNGPFTLVASNLFARSMDFVYTDTNVPGTGPFFYRLGVKPRIGPTVWAPTKMSEASQASAKP